MKMYESERNKVLKLLEKNASRIALTTKMWTASNKNKGYMSITTHFIDDNWTLQSRIVRYSLILKSFFRFLFFLYIFIINVMNNY